MDVYASLAPVDPATAPTGRPYRDRAVGQRVYSAECERFLDYWYGGSAQLHRLRTAMIARGGSVADPRPDAALDDADEYIDDDGAVIRDGRTELITLRYLRKICQDVDVLYAADDLERIYTIDGEPDPATAATLGWYHAPERGGLDAHLHLLDPWLVGLRVVGLLLSWVPDLGEISYEVLPPHWWHVWEHPRYPLQHRIAYAVAYAEAEARDADGRPVAGDVWTCYVRPALPGDPDDAPTRTQGCEHTGRLVRYQSPGTTASDPWPIPEPGDRTILEDGPNPLVEIGGMDDGRRIWSPMIVHTAEPIVEGSRLPVADDLSTLNQELDVGVTEAVHTANLQCRGIPVLTGPGDIPDVVGPEHPVHVLDPSGGFSFAAPGGQPDVHTTVMHRVLQLGGMLGHLPIDSLSLQPPAITTGPALMLRRSDLITERSRRTVDAVAPEVRRFDLERLLHNAYGVTKSRPVIPWETTMAVHWGELSTPVDWGRRLQEMSQELTMGITSLTDLVMERHGVDREEAERRVNDLQTLPAELPENETEARKEFMQGLWKAAQNGSPSAIVQLAVMLGLRSAPGAADEQGSA